VVWPEEEEELGSELIGGIANAIPAPPMPSPRTDTATRIDRFMVNSSEQAQTLALALSNTSAEPKFLAPAYLFQINSDGGEGEGILMPNLRHTRAAEKPYYGKSLASSFDPCLSG
jgi:hypothetical protein